MMDTTTTTRQDPATDDDLSGELPDHLTDDQQQRIAQQHGPLADVPQTVGDLRRERVLLEQGHPAIQRFVPLYEYFTTFRWRANMDARFVAVGEAPEEVSFWKPSLEVRPRELTDAEGCPVAWPNKNRERYYEAIRTTELTEDNAYLADAAWYVATAHEPVVAAFQRAGREVSGLDVSLKSVPESYAPMKPIGADWTFNRQGDFFRLRAGVATERALARSRRIVERFFDVLPRQRPDRTARELAAAAEQ